jgi:hypothetical protein
MVAELNTNAASASAAYMTAVQQYVPTPEFTQHYQHLQELLQTLETVLQQQQLVQQQQQQRQRQQQLQQMQLKHSQSYQQWLQLQSQMQQLQVQQQRLQLSAVSPLCDLNIFGNGLVSSATTGSVSAATATAAATTSDFSTTTKFTTMTVTDSNTGLIADPIADPDVASSSSSSMHAQLSDTTTAAAAVAAAARALARDTVTTRTAAHNTDDKWLTTDPILRSLRGASQHEQQQPDSAVSDSSDSCNTLLNEALADDTPATIQDVDMTRDTAGGFSSMQCGMMSTHAFNTDQCSSSNATHMHSGAAVTAVVGTERRMYDTQVHSDEHTVALLASSSHHTAAGNAMKAHSTTTAAADATDNTADGDIMSVHLTCDTAEIHSSTAAVYTSDRVTPLHITNISNSSAYGSSKSADDMALDDILTSTLTQLMLKTKAGYYTESFRSQQAITHIQKWNTIRHGDVSVKLALLKFWYKRGHIDEQFRAEQAKRAWDTHVNRKCT